MSNGRSLEFVIRHSVIRHLRHLCQLCRSARGTLLGVDLWQLYSHEEVGAVAPGVFSDLRSLISVLRAVAARWKSLGTYDPRVPETDARAILKKDRVDYWLGVGAAVGEGCRVDQEVRHERHARSGAESGAGEAGAAEERSRSGHAGQLAEAEEDEGRNRCRSCGCEPLPRPRKHARLKLRAEASRPLESCQRPKDAYEFTGRCASTF